MRRLVTASLLIALLACASADAREFGANLRRPADSTATCQSFIFFQQVPSCSWTTSGAINNPSESMVVPGNGRINRVRIKVGPQTGPMRVTVAEALRQQNGGESACCTGRRQSRVFTPRRNATTTLKVNMPVRISFNSQSQIYSYDVLFLTMQNASTPIPASLGNQDTGNCSGGWFPAIRPGVENFSGPYGVCGYTILMRANWVRGQLARRCDGRERGQQAVRRRCAPDRGAHVVVGSERAAGRDDHARLVQRAGQLSARQP